MAQFGQLEPFRPETDRLSVYIQRFEMYVAANGVEDSKKVPLFLTVIGGKVFELLHNLLAPASPVEKSFDTLVEALKKHFEPSPVNVIAHRLTFHRRNQASGESVADYLAELRRLATRCEFGGFLEQALRDRLVFGLRGEATQKRLLTEKDITLTRVVEVAQSIEAAPGFRGPQAVAMHHF